MRDLDIDIMVFELLRLKIDQLETCRLVLGKRSITSKLIRFSHYALLEAEKISL